MICLSPFFSTMDSSICRVIRNLSMKGLILHILGKLLFCITLSSAFIFQFNFFRKRNREIQYHQNDTQFVSMPKLLTVFFILIESIELIFNDCFL